jgi:hypothetical protein
MGFLTNSRHSAFIFKKNYFGKPSCGLDMNYGSKENNNIDSNRGGD